MSDCSRNSFLVPDGCGGWKRPDEKPQKVSYDNRTEPKTCGHTLVEHLHMVQEDCRYERKLSDTDSFHCYDVTGGYFDNCIVAKAEEIEQRYQQLEQVAKRMYKFIKHNAESSLDPTMFAAKQYYREDLEALGVVILDD